MEGLEKVKASTLAGSKCFEFYTDWAEKYDKDAGAIVYKGPHVVAAEMAALYPPETRDIEIIDVCAGTGLVGEEALGFTTIDALDGCEAMLAVAAKKQLYREIFCEFIGPHRLKIDDNRYDALTGSGLFLDGAHLKDDCLLELIRIVKPGGHIVFVAGQSHFRDTQGYLKDLEPTMKRHEDAGLWKMIARKAIPHYKLTDAGIVFMFKVL